MGWQRSRSKGMETAASVLTNEGHSNPFLGLWKSPGSENLKITERLQIKGQQIHSTLGKE